MPSLSTSLARLSSMASPSNQWKERIARKIDSKIEAIAAGDPGLLDRVQEQARRRALQSLGLAEMQAELEAVAAQKKELERRERRAQRAMLAAVRRVPVEEVSETFCGGHHPDISKAIQRRQAVHEEELLAEHEQGREVLRLRREKDNLLDTIWLATSAQQVKALWQKVIEL